MAFHGLPKVALTLFEGRYDHAVNDEEAIACVARAHPGLVRDEYLRSARISGYPEFFYVYEVDSERRALTGGHTFVVAVEDSSVYRVSSIPPPRLTCEETRQRRRSGN